MPFALALVASALLHAAALVGSGWTLPGTHEQEPPQTIEAVLARPPLRSWSRRMDTRCRVTERGLPSLGSGGRRS